MIMRFNFKIHCHNGLLLYYHAFMFAPTLLCTAGISVEHVGSTGQDIMKSVVTLASDMYPGMGWLYAITCNHCVSESPF